MCVKYQSSKSSAPRTDSLTPDCMLAIWRFAARRGLPSVLYSDNAKTFVSAAHQLEQEYGPLSPHWKFIVPRSPWWGEIEACVNSRPLTYVGDEPDVPHPLTPSQFLIGCNAGLQLEVNDQPSCITGKDLIVQESVRQQQLHKFWKLWNNGYLRNLPPVVKGFVQKCNVKKGAIVPVRENYDPRLEWPLGIVTNVFPDNDNIIGSVRVNTDKGIVNRPVQKLHDLEMYSDLYEDSEDLKESTSKEIIRPVPGNIEESGLSPTSSRRRGRAIKSPNKLDL
ncbi:uncharacterized protein [Penaeus vannamei]|uniref:uncharacterized protein n=1 Tax=Penaeus vannamei TaxID=6689 RepID=UPI00387F5F11